MTDNIASQNAVVIERSFAAPIDLVWRMWTDPEHFKAWYGPGGATIPVAKMEVRVGGTRLICMEMQTPNGPMQMWFTGEYLQVIEPQRLVYTESISDEHGAVMSTAPFCHLLTRGCLMVTQSQQRYESTWRAWLTARKW